MVVTALYGLLYMVVLALYGLRLPYMVRKAWHRFVRIMSCEDCTKGKILPGEPTGAIDTVSKAYLAEALKSSSRAVVLLTDVYGLPLQNCKILADKLSKELACDVWVPDIFDGTYHLLLDNGLQYAHGGQRLTDSESRSIEPPRCTRCQKDFLGLL
jgi:hypothetical protein